VHTGDYMPQVMVFLAFIAYVRRPRKSPPKRAKTAWD